MKKHITDAKTGIAYTLHGDYYLPDLSLPAEEEIPIGVWGERHKQFLKSYQRGVYNEFLFSGKLQSYLDQIDREAQEMFNLLVRQLVEQEGVTEQLKVIEALEMDISAFYHGEQKTDQAVRDQDYRYASYIWLTHT